jgi:uncharacterized membrane protein YfhO
VMTRAFSADWSALLDGHSLPLFRADGFLTAAFVPSGRHVLELRYDEGPFFRGLFVSSLSAIAALALLWKGRSS